MHMLRIIYIRRKVFKLVPRRERVNVYIYIIYNMLAVYLGPEPLYCLANADFHHQWALKSPYPQTAMMWLRRCSVLGT